MIDMLFFLLQIVGFLVILGWTVVHDRIAAGVPTGGPLAYQASETDVAAHPRERRARRGSSRHRGEADRAARWR